MIKFNHTKEKATRITMRMDCTVEQYALNFLHIFNNAREYPNMFYNLENNSGNDIFVTCRSSDAETIKEYLEQFGTITDEEIINRVIISAQYDSLGWKELFDNWENETEFVVDID